MEHPEFEQFGITEEQFHSLYGRKKKVRNYTFGISSATGIIAGCIFGSYLSQSVYETAVFILFFGGFLGSLFGAVSTILTVALYMLILYLFSSTYRSCRQYLAAKSKAESLAGQ